MPLGANAEGRRVSVPALSQLGLPAIMLERSGMRLHPGERRGHLRKGRMRRSEPSPHQ